MPVYDYICDDCNHQEDFIFSRDAVKNKVTCKKCGKNMHLNWKNKVAIHIPEHIRAVKINNKKVS